MASLALHLGPKFKPPSSLTFPRPKPPPSCLRFYSSSSNSEGGSNGGDPPDKPTSPFASYFSDVKSVLKQQQQQQQRPSQTLPRKPVSFSSQKPQSRVASLEEIRKNLSEFRRLSGPPPPPVSRSPRHQQPVSFQELYKRNVMGNGGDPGSVGPRPQKGGLLSFEAIRESLRQLRNTPSQGTGSDKGGNVADPMSLAQFRNTLKLRPERESPPVTEGSGPLPLSVFGNEAREKEAAAEEGAAGPSSELVKIYTYGELGEKLRQLRPEVKGENWFSLGELNERLVKLREIELKESETKIHGVSFKDLRDSLVKLRITEDNKNKKATIQRLDILANMGGTPAFMLSPPKEHLVEKYFHPDNMSASEKLKTELQKVRDEFKMSESDCGSARVQVAQLTTKIKHLASVLHKKDKHSRKGLQVMVQKRKKLLKYLRRKDWDSYCLVLSKLGLRDVADVKA